MENLPGLSYNFRDFFKFMNYEHFLPLEDRPVLHVKSLMGLSFMPET